MAQNTRLNDAERLALANGWAALRMLLREEVVKFREALCTQRPVDTKAVLVAHQCYFAVATFVNDIEEMVNKEITGIVPLPQQLPDITEELLQ